MQADFNVQDYQALAPNTALPHAHDGFELCLVLSGEATFFFKDQALPVQRGSLVIISPHAVHQTVVKEATPCADVAIRFAPAAVNAYFRRYPKTFDVFAKRHTPAVTVLSDAQINAYTPAFEAFRDACHALDATSEITTYLKLLALLQQLATFANTNGLFDRAVARYTAEFKMLTDYIQAHLAEPLTLQSLSAHFYLSTATIQRICTQTVHMSPIRYVTQLRITAAIELLKSGLNVAAVATMVGYENKSSFSRAFRTIKHMTPSQYVQAHRK